MSGVGFDLTAFDMMRVFSTTLLVAVAVKLMDDYLDIRYDLAGGTVTLAATMGEGVLPYTLAAFAVACAVDAGRAIPLFFSAYAIGMAGDWDRKLPSGLYGYQEGGLALLLNFLLFGWKPALTAVALMLAIQCLDDLRDTAMDGRVAAPNLVLRWGRVESTLAAAAGFLVAAMMDPFLTISAVVSVPVAILLLSPHPAKENGVVDG